jgi:hypothetical protein
MGLTLILVDAILALRTLVGNLYSLELTYNLPKYSEIIIKSLLYASAALAQTVNIKPIKKAYKMGVKMT